MSRGIILHSKVANFFNCKIRKRGKTLFSGPSNRRNFIWKQCIIESIGKRSCIRNVVRIGLFIAHPLICCFSTSFRKKKKNLMLITSLHHSPKTTILKYNMYCKKLFSYWKKMLFSQVYPHYSLNSLRFRFHHKLDFTYKGLIRWIP